MKNIYGYTLESLEQYFESIGEKKFKATQVFEWLYKKRVKSFDEIYFLPASYLCKIWGANFAKVVEERKLET